MVLTQLLKEKPGKITVLIIILVMLALLKQKFQQNLTNPFTTTIFSHIFGQIQIA